MVREKLASDVDDYNYKWIFSKISFTAYHVCEAEWGDGTNRHGTTCTSESIGLKICIQKTLNPLISNPQSYS